MEEKESKDNTKEFKCIKEKCFLYFNSDDYYEVCQLVSKYVLIDKCYGITAIPNKKEEVVCKIANLVKELECLNELEELIKNNQ